HRDDAFGNLLAELVVQAELPGLDELGDLLLHRLADAGDLAELSVAAELRQVDGQAFDRARGIVIGADLEGILVLELKELADGVEDLGDLPVIHRDGVRGRRRTSPAAARRGTGVAPCRPIRHPANRSSTSSGRSRTACRSFPALTRPCDT